MPGRGSGLFERLSMDAVSRERLCRIGSMKTLVYVETSVISMLTARPRADVEIAGFQKATADWWPGAQRRFELVISEFVLEEAAKGDAEAAERRLTVLRDGLRVVTADDAQVSAVAEQLVIRGAMPQKARFDALHVAICACSGVEFLATWNFKHLANAQRALLVEQVCRELGYEPPRIVTPLELLED